MTTPDLNALSLDELKNLRKDVTKAIDNFEARRRQEALNALQDKAKEFGFSLDEFTGSASRRTRKTASAPKYRHPEDPTRTWTGRGRQPDWIKEALSAGQSKENFLIGQ